MVEELEDCFHTTSFTSFPKCLIRIFEIMFSKLTFKKNAHFQTTNPNGPRIRPGPAQPSQKKAESWNSIEQKVFFFFFFFWVKFYKRIHNV